MTPSELSRELARDAETVCRYLLPEGKRDGREWRVGSCNGEPGKSMGVRISGDRQGVWSDFATGQAGDMLSLWQEVRACDIVTAIREAKDFLGIRDEAPRFSGYQKPTFKSPVKPKCNKPKGSVLDYLTKTRCLTPETLAAFQVAESGHRIIYPYLRHGELVMCKTDTSQRDANGKRMEPPKPTSAEQEPCLFGWQALDPNTRWVVICEGEIDAMTWHQLGIPSLSVPFGGGAGAKQRWIEFEFENLGRFDEFLLAMDNDPVGMEATAEIMDRLGSHRCRVVRGLQTKDINEALQQGITPEIAKSLIDQAEAIGPSELKSAVDYTESVIKEFYPVGEEPGILLPWNWTHSKIRLRPSELVIVNGINGHGKTEVAGHILVDALRQGYRGCVASMEIKPAKLLGRTTKQAAAVTQGKPTDPYIRAIMDWYRDKLWLFDVVGSAKADKLLEVFEYARKRYGVDLFVIDSLMKCGIGEDDYNGQKLFVERLCDFKNAHDCTVILITHSRKTESEMNPSGKMDIKGTGTITDLADTILNTWRNKPKEREMAKLEAPELHKVKDPEALEEDLRTKPDALVDCLKQRNGDWEGRIGLWFDRNCHQYLPSPDMRPRPYVNFEFRPCKAGGAA